MLLIGPISVFSFAFFWVAILLHTQVTHLHLDGPQGVQQRVPARQIRRIVGPPRKRAQSYECRLDQMAKRVTRQLIDLHEAEKQRQQYEFVYTTCVQNLETSHENLSVLQSTVQYLCEQSPYDHPSTHAHFQDVVDNLQLQEDGLHRVYDQIRAGI